MLPRPALLAVCALTALTMLPVTGVVPVLKPLVQDRYGVGAFATSSFMALNMAGALVAAPLAGGLADRRGWTRGLLVGGALADAFAWAAMATLPPFPWLAALRTFEGMAHITVLSMLLTVVSRASEGEGRRARMAGAGAAIVLGVAVGAPLGGRLGATDPTAPLVGGAWLMLAVAGIAAVVVPRGGGPATLRRDVPWTRELLRPLWAPYAFSFADRFSVGVLVVAFPLHAAGVLGMDPPRIGLLLGAQLLPFALLNWPAGRLGERFGAGRLVVGGSVVYGALYAAVPWTPERLLLPLMVATGVVSAVMFGPTLVLVLARSTPETRARAVGGFNAAGSLGFLLGPLCAGIALEAAADLGTAAAHGIVFAVGASSQFAAVLFAARALR